MSRDGKHGVRGAGCGGGVREVVVVVVVSDDS